MIMIIIIIILIRSTQFCGMSSTWLRCWTAASTRSSTAPTISQVYIHYLTGCHLSCPTCEIEDGTYYLRGCDFPVWFNMSFPQKGASQVQEAYPQWPGKLLCPISRAGQKCLTCRVESFFLQNGLFPVQHPDSTLSFLWRLFNLLNILKVDFARDQRLLQTGGMNSRQKICLFRIEWKRKRYYYWFFFYS